MILSNILTFFLITKGFSLKSLNQLKTHYKRHQFFFRNFLHLFYDTNYFTVDVITSLFVYTIFSLLANNSQHTCCSFFSLLCAGRRHHRIFEQMRNISHVYEIKQHLTDYSRAGNHSDFIARFFGRKTPACISL